MKLAFLVTNMAVGGIATAVLNLCQTLGPLGHEITVVAQAHGEWWSRLADIGVTRYCLPQRPWESIVDRARRLAAYLVAQQFDGLMVFIGIDNRLPMLCLHELPDSLPVLIALRNDRPEVYALAAVNRAAWNCAVAVSPKVQATAAARLVHKPIHYIPNGFDLPTPAQWHKRVAWELPLRLLFVGRLIDQQKGIFRLPTILAACRRQNMPVRLTVIGDGPDRAHLSRLLIEAGVHDLVELWGEQAHASVLAAMRTHHVLLMPSNFEGFPNVLLEAQVNGCVPLASRLPGSTDVAIQEGVSGILFDPADDVAFMDGLATLLAPNCWQAYSHAGIQHIVQHFSPQQIGDRYIALFEALRQGVYPLPVSRATLREQGITPFTRGDYLPQPLRIRLHKTVPAIKKLIRSIRLTSGKVRPKPAIEQAAIPDRVIRCPKNPIISALLTERVGDNINGPSLIKAPEWLPNPLGRYYLYFAHHKGDTIRLAYADDLAGPWHIYAPGTLTLAETICADHIASPDLHIDHEKQEIRMYFHGPVAAIGKQLSLAATSKDGIHFTASSAILGDSYFRVFEWQGYTYAMARLGVLYRSKDGLTNFERGPNPFQMDSSPSTVRHVALKLDGNVLSVFYSRIGDNPESILLATIELLPNWRAWKASEAVLILKPEMAYEGADLPYAPSKEGLARSRVRQLRDPAIFREEGKDYLLYSVAGESGIALAELQGGH